MNIGMKTKFVNDISKLNTRANKASRELQSVQNEFIEVIAEMLSTEFDIYSGNIDRGWIEETLLIESNTKQPVSTQFADIIAYGQIGKRTELMDGVNETIEAYKEYLEEVL